MADDDKEKLEKKKLKAEIREIKLRVSTERNRIKFEKKRGFKFANFLKNWVAIFLTFIAVGSGIVTIWIKSSTFLAQKEKEYDFKVNQEMIVLVNQLSSKEQNKREDAKLLLSNFEKDAIPILMGQLKRNETAEAAEVTIDSLRLVNEKINSSIVIDELYDSAEKVFERESLNPDMNIKSVRNYIIALGELGKEKEKDVVKLFDYLETQIASRQEPVPYHFGHIITNSIKQAKKKLTTNHVTH